MGVSPSWSCFPFFFDDTHLRLGEELEGSIRPGDEALFDPKAVGPRLAELGLLRLLVPALLGGRTVGRSQLDPSSVQLDVRALCIARERLAYISPLADAVFAVQGLSAHPFVLCPSAARRSEVLRDVMQGVRIGGFALTEPEAGSDVSSMRARDTRNGDDWILDGEKVFISNVGIAHHFIVFAHAEANGAPSPSAPPSMPAKEPGAPPCDQASGQASDRASTAGFREAGTRGPKRSSCSGVSAFLVPADCAGLTLERIDTTGDHPLGRLSMDRCRLGPDALIGEVGSGLRLALGTLDVFRTSVGAAAVGMSMRALDETITRVTSRVQFGRRIADFQLTQAALADMATELDTARLIVLRAAWTKDHDRAGKADVAMAKLHATEAAQRIIDRAVQLHGGLGVTRGTVVENLYREVRPLRIYEGTSEIQKLIIGASLVSPKP